MSRKDWGIRKAKTEVLLPNGRESPDITFEPSRKGEEEWDNGMAFNIHLGYKAFVLVTVIAADLLLAIAHLVERALS